MKAHSPSFAPAVDGENPWLGLASFTEESRAFFHGRDEEVAELSRRVQRKLLTVLFGQSGLGKTSILRAGVVPRLRDEGCVPVYVRIDYSAGAPLPTEQVKQAVLAATAAAGTWSKPSAQERVETLWEFLHHRDDALRDAHGRALTPLIIFDQFEEVFTLAQSDEAGRQRAADFFDDLADLVENRAPRLFEAKLESDDSIVERFDFTRADYRVLISLREDYLPHLESLKSRMPSVTQNRVRLAPMTGAQALDAVVKPGGALATADVARAIVEFVAGAKGGSIERLAELQVEPPLLSVICRELNDRRRALGQGQITADLVTGNRREILTDFYERSVGDIPEEMRRFVEDKLLTKSGFRDNLALETALEEPGVARPLIDTLVSRRLLRIEDRIGTRRVELTHDVLADVVRASRDARQQRLLLEQAREREQRALAEAARRTRRMRVVIASLTIIVVALGVGAVFEIRAQKASAAQAGQTDLVLGSRLLDEGKLSEGLAYLVRAGRKDPTNRLITPRLLTALTSRNFMLPIGAPLSLPSPPIDGETSPDGRWILVESEDRILRQIDVTNWQIARELTVAGKLRRGGIVFPAASSGRFALAFEDNTIEVRSTATGERLFESIRAPARIGSYRSLMHFSPDGRWIAAASGNEVLIWNAATGEQHMSVPTGGSHRGFVFSPDGNTLAASQRQTIQMWFIPERRAVGAPIESGSPVIYPLFTADGRRLVIWNYEGVLVCDAGTGAVLRSLPVNTALAYHVQLTPDDRKLVYTSTNRLATVIDLETGKPAYPDLQHAGTAPVAQIVEGGRVLLTNSVDGRFRLWNLETGALLAEPTLRQPQLSHAWATPDGKTVALVTREGRLFKFRLGSGPARPLALPRTSRDTLLVNLTVGSPTGLIWLTPTEAKVIDVPSGRLRPGGFRLPQPAVAASRSGYGATLGPGDVVGVRLADESWRLWTFGVGGIENDIAIPLASGSAVANAVDSKLQRLAIALGRGSPHGPGVGILDTRTGAQLSVLRTTGVSLLNRSVSFSPDGKRVALRSVSDGIVRIFDIETAQELFTLELSGKAFITAVRYSLDGKRLISGDNWGALQIWDAADGKLLQSTQAHRAVVTRLDFSPNGRHYVSLSQDGTAQVWNAATDRPNGEVLEQAGAATRADFSPDAQRIATPSTAGSARVWDVATGLPVTDLLPTDSDVASVVAYSPDGRFLDVHGPGSLRFQHVRMFAAPPPNTRGRVPEWLLTLATICAGHRLNENGKLVSAMDELSKIDEVQRALAAAPADDPHAQWARWFLSDSPNRPIAPGFTITPAEAKKLREEFAAPPARAGPASNAP